MNTTQRYYCFVDVTAQTKENENTVNKLKDRIRELEGSLASKETQINGLNGRVESLLVSSLNDNQKRTQLQDRIDVLEKQLKETQSSLPSSPSSPATIMGPAATQSLLSQTHQQVEELREAQISLKKENALLRSKNQLMKEENTELKAQCSDLSSREAALQQANRLLRTKLITEEGRLMELSESARTASVASVASIASIASVAGETKESEDPLVADLRRQVASLREVNQRLFESLKSFTHFKCIPVEGTEDVSGGAARDA